MLRITKQTDYGFMLLVHMASYPQKGPHNAKELAADAMLPKPMVSKILKLLAKNGILLSHRGVNGGYELARSPHEITAGDVIEALEGPIAVTECSEVGAHICSVERMCPVRVSWKRINGAVKDALEQITLWEMIHPVARSLMDHEHESRREVVAASGVAAAK